MDRRFAKPKLCRQYDNYIVSSILTGCYIHSSSMAQNLLNKLKIGRPSTERVNLEKKDYWVRSSLGGKCVSWQRVIFFTNFVDLQTTDLVTQTAFRVECSTLSFVPYLSLSKMNKLTNSFFYSASTQKYTYSHAHALNAMHTRISI